MTTRRALEVVAAVRERVAVPLVPMTYASPVMAYGERRFCADAAAAGADALIVPDVPADEAAELLAGCREHGLDLVPLLAPTSADARIALACAQAGGFVYLVSVAGITGARAQLSDRVAGLVTRVRAHTGLPLLVGIRHLGARARGGGTGRRRRRRDHRLEGDRGRRAGRRGGARGVRAHGDGGRRGWKQPITTRYDWSSSPDVLGGVRSRSPAPSANQAPTNAARGGAESIIH